MKYSRLSRRQTFIRETIIGFGFLSGVWIHLGFDPQSFAFAFLQKLLVGAEPQYSQVIIMLFFTLPIILTCVSILGTYKKAGWFGLAAVGLAFYAGYVFELQSIILLIVALVVGFLAARK